MGQLNRNMQLISHTTSKSIFLMHLSLTFHTQWWLLLLTRQFLRSSEFRKQHYLQKLITNWATIMFIDGKVGSLLVRIKLLCSFAFSVTHTHIRFTAVSVYLAMVRHTHVCLDCVTESAWMRERLSASVCLCAWVRVWERESLWKPLHSALQRCRVVDLRWNSLDSLSLGVLSHLSFVLQMDKKKLKKIDSTTMALPSQLFINLLHKSRNKSLIFLRKSCWKLMKIKC